ncbi:hypothetical protein [Pinirhizobacter sp.]|jgi:hypothetical protein|uniref:hypothetical protein n=1 Tax=Pinirhizobacter sp. TaxID=2950432 RepID=UPI002F4085BF
MRWRKRELYDLDEKYAIEGVARHARPMRAALDLLGPNFAMVPGGNPAVTEIIDAYRALFSDSDNAWPGSGIGLVASIDRVVNLVLPVVFGSPGPFEPWRAGPFESEEAWRKWCRGDPGIAAAYHYAFADLHYFSHGAQRAIAKTPASKGLLQMEPQISRHYRGNFRAPFMLTPLCRTSA